MTKEIIIIALILALIYLYYQNRKLKGLPADSHFEWEEPRPRKTALIFDKDDDEELIAERDAAIRTKNETEAELLSVSNKLRHKQSEVTRKETEIERLKQDKSQVEISLNKKITEKNGLITTLQREINQQKEKFSSVEQELVQHKENYHQKVKLLDEERLENNKLNEKIEQLEQQVQELKSSKSPLPGSFPGDQVSAEQEPKVELEKTHQEQLRKINLLFDANAKDYKEIDFNGLYELLKGISERERANPDQEVKPIFSKLRKKKV